MTTTTYYLKKPDNFRRSFAIYGRVINPDGSTKNETLANTDIDAVNRLYASKQLSFNDALKQLKNIKNRLNNIVPAIFNADNEAILDAFFKQYFAKHPFIIDKNSAIHKYKRAVRAIGKHSLLTITANEALECTLALGTNESQREASHKLNSLFTYLNREIKVPTSPKEFQDVKFISEAELTKLLAHMPESDIKAGISVSFYAGTRIGEIRALQLHKLLPGHNTININEQLDINNKVRPPKNRKKRKAFLHPSGLSAFKQWCQRTVTPSHDQLNGAFQAACAKHLGRTDLTWHDLRHSYAIHLLSAGVPIQLVSQSMGNSVRVCETCYSGFILSDYGIDTISRMINK